MKRQPEAGRKDTGFSACWEAPLRPEKILLRELDAETFSPGADLDSRIDKIRREDVDHPVIFVGTGTCGLGAGAGRTLDAVRAWVETSHDDADVVEVGCIGLCSEEPIVDVQLPGRPRVSFGKVLEDQVSGLLDSVLAGTISDKSILGQFRSETVSPWEGVPFLDEHTFLAPQRRLVLANSGIIDPRSIDEYIARGGYSAFAKVLRTQTPEQVCQSVQDSGLRGRGGGGFPTGKKWKFAGSETAEQKYLICNADEGDPGAFMDRAVAESDPHRLLEGMFIAAYAIGAKKSYIYIRAEYPLGIARLERAIEQAREYGLLGSNILDSGFSQEVVIKMGAGAFVCGEETALIHSVEGRRGMPRPRPPYPVVKGVFGNPTVINNVETLANIPSLMIHGPENFAAMGTKGSKGTKVFALSGMIRRTGLAEVPMGTTIRDVVFKIGGGVPGGKKCKAVQIGGPSGGCIPEVHMDIACDYEVLKEFGAIMGSGGLVVLDENTCMVDLAKFFMGFIQKESCGKCIPCREGTRRMLEILEAITRNSRLEEDQDALLRFQGVMALEELGEVIKKTSLCGLGQTAPNPVLSTLRWFRDEYEAHVFERRCPAGTCKDLVGAPCQTACPVGTEVWRYVANAALEQYEDAYKVIRKVNPFPSVCARICSHPCESMCRSGTTGGEPIAARTLKRFIVDRVDPAVYRIQQKPAGPDAKRVAVVGGGPSGLTAAHHLSLKGHRITVFEREDRPGGMMVCGIPAYRLPRDVIEREIAALLNDNIDLRCNQALGRDFTVDSLLADGFDAVYLALGSHQSRLLGMEGEDAKGVYHGIRFLKANNLRDEHLGRGRVVIIGGGNSAVDAARVAVRQKGVDSVKLLGHEMFAHPEELDAAIEEGVTIVPNATPVRIRTASGCVTGVDFIRNSLGRRDDSGHPGPVLIEGSEFTEEMDTLIVAISESPEIDTLDEGLTRTGRGTLSIHPESLATSRTGVFGGGDVVAGPRTVIEAIADGKNAAVMIDRYLFGRRLQALPGVRLPEVYIEPFEDDEESEEVVARVHAAMISPEKRLKGFDEVEHSISEREALREARRCLRCDLDFTRPL